MNRLFLVFALILLLAACTPRSAGPAGAQPTTTVPPLSSNGKSVFVETDGKQFVIRCFGEGTPAVILENGYNVDWSEWKEVIAGIREQTRICAYDRLTPATTSLEAADDLHILLKRAGLAPPYILAGHSLGGFTVILFASRHPGEVAGAVLVDSSHPDGNARVLAALPTPSVTDSQELKDLREALQSTGFGSFDWKTSTGQVRAVTSLGAIPLAVVEASPENISGLGNIGSDELKKQIIAVRHELQISHALLSTRSALFTSSHSGHMVPLEDPGLVIEAILSLLPATPGE